MMRFTIGEPAGGVVGSGDGSTPARFPGTPEPNLSDQSQGRHHSWSGLRQIRQRRYNNAKVFTELATPRWIKRYISARASREDYWDYDGDKGMLRRHHAVRRTDLFGHDPLDPLWNQCPIPRRDLSS